MSAVLDWAAAEVQRRLELRTKQIQLSPLSNRGGWWPLIREPYPGAWQRNDEVGAETVLAYGAVFACVTLIASDIAKLALRLVQQTSDGIWEETESPAFSPVLRKPNRYQSIIKFVESWIISKLTQGNAYILKARDQRRLVVEMHVLDPMRVVPLVAQNGDVYYELKRDDLAGQPLETRTVPASEVIHDPDACLYHPLVGVTRITAAGLAALQGMAIQKNSNKLFSNGSIPGGILTAPGAISDATAARLKEYWDTNFSGDNVGKVAVVGDNLKYEALSWNAADLQLIEQLKQTGKDVCIPFHVPPYMVGIGDWPPYANVAPALQQYYSQCLQTLINCLEKALDEGLELPKPYGTELDIDDLIWMDLQARGTAAKDSVGTLSTNEARKRFYNAKPAKGGESPMVQQQYYSLGALAERDAAKPFAKPAQPTPEPAPSQDDNLARTASFASVLHKKATEAGLYAA